MLSDLFYRRNPLNYPVSLRSGVDPTHPATQGIAMSGIASGGNFVSLLNGQRFAATGTPAGVIKAGIGPAVSTVGSTTGMSITPSSAGALPRTWAAIFTNARTGGTGALVITGGSAAGLYASGGTTLALWDGTSQTNLMTLTNDVPYFCALSTNGVSTIWVVTNLNTGQIFSGSFANAHTPTWGTTSYIGNVSGGGQEFQGNIAAAMVGSAALAPLALIAWAKDPWAFWYPRRETFPTLPAQFTAGGVSGTLATTEAADVAAFVGTAGGASGTLTVTEAKDIAALVGTAGGASGTLTVTEATDTAAFTGTGVSPSGILIAIEASDIAAFTGTVVAPSVTGILTALELSDSAAFVGSAAGLPSGSLLVTEAADTARFTLSFIPKQDQARSRSTYDYGWEAGKPIERPTKWT